MKITQKITPNAVLPEDRKGPLSLDFSNSLIFSRNQYGLFLGNGIETIDLRWAWQLWKFTKGHKKAYNS